MHPKTILSSPVDCPEECSLPENPPLRSQIPQIPANFSHNSQSLGAGTYFFPDPSLAATNQEISSTRRVFVSHTHPVVQLPHLLLCHINFFNYLFHTYLFLPLSQSISTSILHFSGCLLSPFNHILNKLPAINLSKEIEPIQSLLLSLSDEWSDHSLLHKDLLTGSWAKDPLDPLGQSLPGSLLTLPFASFLSQLDSSWKSWKHGTGRSHALRASGATQPPSQILHTHSHMHTATHLPSPMILTASFSHEDLCAQRGFMGTLPL